jgi:hypothetical protein
MTRSASRVTFLRWFSGWFPGWFIGRSLACLAIGLSVAASTPALAEPAAQVAGEWGLLGTWALDCTLPPDRDRGARISYRIVDGGRLILARDFGDASDISDIPDARLEPDGSLRLTVTFPAIRQTRIYTLAKDSDGNIRAMSNRDSKGRYSIRAGRFSATGQPTPKQARCALNIPNHF